MHVAGMRPQFVAQADVPAAALHAERQLLLAQAQQDSSLASKPQAVLEGIVNGRLNKWKQVGFAGRVSPLTGLHLGRLRSLSLLGCGCFGMAMLIILPN